MPAPRIGITTRTVVEGGRAVTGTDVEYAEAVTQAGGIPLHLPGQAGDQASEVLTSVDGLVLSGGGDIDPRFYCQEPSTKVGGVDRQRDEWELDLTTQAVSEAVPVLGICRGCQILNVAGGGTLIQDLAEVTTVDHLVTSPRDQISHFLAVQPNSRLSEIVGPEDLAVNTIHHQAVESLGAGFQVGARSDDGIVESIELKSKPVLGVQWHPENLLSHPRHQKLFSWLVRQSQVLMARRAEMRVARSGACSPQDA